MLLKSRHIYNDMAKILKIQTGTVDVVVTQEFDDEDIPFNQGGIVSGLYN